MSLTQTPSICPFAVVANRPTLASLPDCSSVLAPSPSIPESCPGVEESLGARLHRETATSLGLGQLQEDIHRPLTLGRYSVLGLLGLILLGAALQPLIFGNPQSQQQLQAIRSLLKPQETAFLGLEHPAGKLLAAAPTDNGPKTLHAGAGYSVNHGRQDPLQPLVHMAKPTQAEEIARQDPLTGVSFVGLLEGPANGKSASKRDIAMIEVIDAASQETKTLVKPVGELFYSNGSSIQIKKANQGLLEVIVDGETRHLPLTLGQASLGKKDKPGDASTDAVDKLAE